MKIKKTELEEALRRAKFCMKRRVMIQYNGAEYLPHGLYLQYSEQDGFFYSIELIQNSRRNCLIIVPLNDVDLPAEGGGYKLAD